MESAGVSGGDGGKCDGGGGGCGEEGWDFKGGVGYARRGGGQSGRQRLKVKLEDERVLVAIVSELMGEHSVGEQRVDGEPVGSIERARGRRTEQREEHVHVEKNIVALKVNGAQR